MRRGGEILRLVLGVALVYAALPVKSSPVNSPYYSAPPPQTNYYEAPAYSPPVYQTYEAPAYEAPTYSSYSPPQYESYQPPSYSPPPAYEAPSYYEPPAPAYQPSYQAPSYAPKVEYYPEYTNFEAITFRELNESIHCGVVPAVNSELYKLESYNPTEYGYSKNNFALSTKTQPFGQSPYTVLITDDYNNILCQGAIINTKYVLTLSSCVSAYDLTKLRVRYGDWDILNNKNEYESYQNSDCRICRTFPITCSYAYAPPPSYGSYSSQAPYKQESYNGLTLLETEFDPDKDQYPQVRAVCLPEYYPVYTAPTYQAPAYQASVPAYSPAPYAAPAPYSAPAPYAAPAPAYAPPTYAPPAYQAPTYKEEYYSECYVAGYYGSPTTKLENHKRPVPYEGYGYQKPPTYPSTSYGSYYEEEYQSRVPKIAKVKQIKCEGYSGYKKSPPSGYGAESCEENLCFVGVDGDACVADFGAPVVCLVPEKEEYESGYGYSYDTPTYASQPYSTPYTPPYSPSYASQPTSYGYEQKGYYQKEIRAIEAQAKPERKRAVIVAVVEYPAQCSSTYKPKQYGYGYQAEEYQSKPLVSIKVTEKVVNFILQRFFEGSADSSCPVPTNYYPEPQYTPAYQPSYQEPAYKPAYQEPAYQEPAYKPAYQEPAYQPAYQEPAYKPAYQEPVYQPAYQEPAYQAPYQPAYQEPAYQAPYQPAYQEPVYQAPYQPAYQEPVYQKPYQEPVYNKPAYSPPSPY